MKSMLVKSLSAYVRLVEQQVTEWKQAYGPVLEPVFRGHADRSWDLVPSLMRNGGFDKLIEDSLLNEFQRGARPFLADRPSNFIQWLALAQHHGLPTRLLDFSESSLVALFFAVQDEHLYASHLRKPRDACVWMMNRKALHDELGLADPLVLLDDPSSSWPEPLSRIAEAEAPGVFVFTPVHLSARMPVQKAAFVLFGNQPQALEKMRDQPHLMRQLVVPRRCVAAIRHELEIAGMTYATLFPDLDGIARDVWQRERRRRAQEPEGRRAHTATRPLDGNLRPHHPPRRQVPS